MIYIGAVTSFAQPRFINSEGTGQKQMPEEDLCQHLETGDTSVKTKIIDS